MTVAERLHPDDITLDLAPRPRPDVTSVEVDGEAVVYSPHAGVHRLDTTAAVLWRCFDGDATLREVADDLADVFADEEPSRLRADLLAYARDLGRAGLLDRVDPGDKGGHAAG